MTIQGTNDKKGRKLGMWPNSLFHLKERGQELGFSRATNELNEAFYPVVLIPLRPKGYHNCSILLPSHFFLPLILLFPAYLFLKLWPMMHIFLKL